MSTDHTMHSTLLIYLHNITINLFSKYYLVISFVICTVLPSNLDRHAKIQEDLKTFQILTIAKSVKKNKYTQIFSFHFVKCALHYI